jgi:MoxR-like ATPase
VFGIKTLRGNVAVWPRHGEEGADLNVKRVDAGHIWDEEHLQWVIFCAGEYSATGAWFHGNRGAGKTEFATQFAAATGRPFYKVTFTRTMEPSEFLGDTGAAGGDSVWQDGRILMGLRNPIPSVFLLDEISYGQSSHISGPINEIVHPDCSYTIPKTGEVVNFSKSHLFIAADNTNGTGDVSGMYEGVNNVNRATMDRFSYFRRFTYLPPALEQKMIQNRALCSPAIATKVWSLLDALRKKVDSGELKDPPSVREATAMAKALRSGLFTDADAFESSFVGKYPEDVQEDVRVTFVATFKQA